ncbi:MAG: hypothetical protein ACREFC_00935, partial [Stellaceae bacterium]
TYLGLIFWAPLSCNGDVLEFRHRQFVMLYAVVLLWTIVRLAAIAGLTDFLRRLRPRRATAIGAGFALAIVVGCHDVEPARPLQLMTWAKRYYDVPVEPGLPRAAAFLRAHARPGDIMAVPVADAYDQLFGPANELIGLTGIPIYVARIEYNSKYFGVDFATLTARRAGEIAAIEREPDRAGALAALRTLGIAWYVAVGPHLPAWDADGADATFHAGTTFVYDSGLRHTSSGNGTIR